nr:SigB/SigF/SigG family RNA polymerase sigma factor [uncultured Blautia sp.]
MDDILALLGRAHQGDKEARDILTEKNMGLVHSIARRFQNRGVEMEDLVQIGSIGLLKAIDKFDTGYDVKFSTYAVPMITGEIKRFLRDDGMVKVSRPLKEEAARAYAVREELFLKTGREPALEEIAAELNIDREELVLAMESAVQIESLQKTIFQSDGSGISLEDKLPQEKNQQEEVLDRLLLQQMLGMLEPKERELIYLRFFMEKTQTCVAKKMGMSQVQVSRLEKKILSRLREKL